MRELLTGLSLIVSWIGLQYLVQPRTGWIHAVLIVGVVLVIRGVVARDAERHG